MDLLLRLIPSTLSSRINATLAAVRNESNNGYDYIWRVLELTVPGFDPMMTIQTPLWSDADDIFQFSQLYLLYFRLQAKMQYHFTDRVRSSTFLRAVHHSEYADTITTLQSHVNLYREDFDTGFLPAHLHIHGLAESIHLNAQAWLHNINAPRVWRIAYNRSVVQGLPLTDPHSPSINRLGCHDHNALGYRDSEGSGPGNGYLRGTRDRARDGREGVRGTPAAPGQDDRSRTPRGRPVARPDRNRRPYLFDVQCVACKRVSHVAKHCDMLATAICLERYMKHNLSPAVRNSIEQDWLARWKECLGNPTTTP
jgi:hypothetical protein